MFTVKEYRKNQWKLTDPDYWGDNYVYIRMFESGNVEVQGIEYVSITPDIMDMIITTLLLIRSRTKELVTGEPT